MKAIGLIILVLIVIFFVIYAIAPVYKFSDAEVFSGDKIYNPYQDMDSTNWKKGNFQVQSRVWMGITNGRNNSNEAIQIVYKQLGYDIIVTSDYMKINDFGEGNNWHIPTYEHGYSIRKVHQVCIGSHKVNWIDYPFYQNISHKQHIINILHENNDIVCLAHPDLRDGYLLDDMRKLSNYDLMEVLNEIRKSPHHWDAALSSGHSIFILANDDAHNVFDPTEVGRMCTFINTKSLDSKDVIDALKSGKAFGADIAMRQGADLVEKAEDHERIAMLKNVSVVNDTLFIELSEKAKLFAFIGQNGIVKSNVVDTNLAVYPIELSDTYVRTEITFENGNKFYLNPVYRYSGDAPVKQLNSKMDYVKTWVQRGVALIIVILLIIIIARISKRPKSKGRISSRSNNYYIR